MQVVVSSGRQSPKDNDSAFAKTGGNALLAGRSPNKGTRKRQKERFDMIEQHLAHMFKDFATKIKWHRAEIAARVPEVSEICAEFDGLIEFLESQSRAFSACGSSSSVQDEDQEL